MKWYVLASSEGIVLNLFLSTADRELPRAAEIGSVAAIVYRLLDCLGPDEGNFYHKGHRSLLSLLPSLPLLNISMFHRLLTDNFYSSVGLFR